MKDILLKYFRINKYFNNTAFSLVEFMFVISIAAILLSMSVLITNKIIRREKVADATNRIVSMIKEAQRLSQIDMWDNVSGEDWGYTIPEQQLYGIMFNENDVKIIKTKDLSPDNESEYNEMTSYLLKGVRLVNDEDGNINNLRIYFTDLGYVYLLPASVILEDLLGDYRKGISISAMGRVNVQNID